MATAPARGSFPLPSQVTSPHSQASRSSAGPTTPNAASAAARSSPRRRGSFGQTVSARALSRCSRIFVSVTRSRPQNEATPFGSSLSSNSTYRSLAARRDRTTASGSNFSTHKSTAPISCFSECAPYSPASAAIAVSINPSASASSTRWVRQVIASITVAETAPDANRPAVRGSRSRNAWAMRICLDAACEFRLHAADTAACAHAHPSMT